MPMPTVNEIYREYYNEDLPVFDAFNSNSSFRNKISDALHQYELKKFLNDYAFSLRQLDMVYGIKIVKQIATAITCYLLENKLEDLFTRYVPYFLNIITIPLDLSKLLDGKLPSTTEYKVSSSGKLSGADIHSLLSANTSEKLWLSRWRSKTHDDSLKFLAHMIHEDSDQHEVINRLAYEYFNRSGRSGFNAGGRFATTVGTAFAMAKHLPVNAELYKPYIRLIKKEAYNYLTFFNSTLNDPAKIILDYVDHPKNAVEFYFELPKDIRAQQSTEYSKKFEELDSETIVNTAAIMLRSIGINDECFHSICVGPEYLAQSEVKAADREEKKPSPIPSAKWSFAEQFKTAIFTNPAGMKKPFIFFVIPTRGVEATAHAVSIVIDTVKKKIYCVDPEGDAHLGMTHTLEHLQEAKRELPDFFAGYTDPQHPNTERRSIQQEGDDKLACGFYSICNIVGLIAKLKGWNKLDCSFGEMREFFEKIEVSVGDYGYWGGISSRNKDLSQICLGIVAIEQMFDLDAEKLKLHHVKRM